MAITMTTMIMMMVTYERMIKGNNAGERANRLAAIFEWLDEERRLFFLWRQAPA